VFPVVSGSSPFQLARDHRDLAVFWQSERGDYHRMHKHLGLDMVGGVLDRRLPCVAKQEEMSPDVHTRCIWTTINGG
jgi:hypothetical protein